MIKIVFAALALFSIATLGTTATPAAPPQALACPPAGTCFKAYTWCRDHPEDMPWCGILDRCVACGWPF